VPARVVVEDTSPTLNRVHRLRNFGEICHSTAMRLLQLGVEQPQDDNVNTVMITDGLNNRLNVLPPRRCNGHSWQAADQVTFGRHQH
jgi:hypothetical protein